MLFPLQPSPQNNKVVALDFAFKERYYIFINAKSNATILLFCGDSCRESDKSHFAYFSLFCIGGPRRSPEDKYPKNVSGPSDVSKLYYLQHFRHAVPASPNFNNTFGPSCNGTPIFTIHYKPRPRPGGAYFPYFAKIQTPSAGIVASDLHTVKSLPLHHVPWEIGFEKI